MQETIVALIVVGALIWLVRAYIFKSKHTQKPTACSTHCSSCHSCGDTQGARQESKTQVQPIRFYFHSRDISN